MLQSLSSAVSGLQNFQTSLDIIGNNIANSNTYGFKSSRADFEDAFSDTLGSNVQVGSGVTTGSVTNLFGQGTVSTTGQATDLAISGDGFFTVTDPETGTEYATRAGDFELDKEGYLVTGDGLRVQGFSNSGLTTRGDVRIDTTGMPATSDANATIDGYSIDADGKITVKLSDGTSFVRGQVLLQSYTSPQALQNCGNNLYTNLANAGPLAQSAAPGTSGLGDLQSGALEQSNVDLTTEFSNLITTQRGFQANARVITTSDEILQELIGLKR